MSTPQDRTDGLDPTDPLVALEAAELAAAPDETPAVEQETPAEEAARLYAGKYASPDELERAYEELQRSHGQQGQELGTLRDVVEGIGGQQQQQQPEPEQDGLISREVWNDWYMREPYDAIVYLNQVGAAQVIGHVEERMDERLEPLVSAEDRRLGDRTIQLLKQDLGDDVVMRHGDKLSGFIANMGQPMFDKLSETQRHDLLRTVTMGLEVQAQNGGTPAAAAPPGRQETVHMAAGSGPTPAGGQAESDVDPILSGMQAAANEIKPAQLLGPRPFIPGNDPAVTRRR